MSDKLEKQLNFIIEIDKMKTVLRQTLLMDKSRQETDAEHSWHFAMAAWILYEYTDPTKVNLNRVIRMALTHDLVEIYAGDTFAYDEKGYTDKEERERAAAKKLFALLPEEQAGEFQSLWEEFEAMETPDARYAAAIDRLQPFISNYQTDGHTWALHHVTEAQIFRRMAPIKDELPQLWPFVERVVADAKARGYVK